MNLGTSSRSVRRGAVRLAVVAGVVGSSLVASESPASAATITVTSGGDVTADDGVTTLREAVADAANGDIIVFDATVVAIELTQGQLVLGKDLTIGDAAASGRMPVEAADDSFPDATLIFVEGNASPTLTNLALSGLKGNTSLGQTVYATTETKTLTLDNVSIARGGNGVRFDAPAGSLVVTGSEITAVKATGIAASTGVSVSLTDTVIDGATVGLGVDGVAAVAISNSEIRDGSTGVDMSEVSTATIVDSIIDDHGKVGIRASDPGDVTIETSRISNTQVGVNRDGADAPGSMTIRSSTFDANGTAIADELVGAVATTIENSTFTANGGSFSAAIESDTAVDISHSTIAGNIGTSALGDPGPFVVDHTIISGNDTNFVGDDSSVVTLSYSLVPSGNSAAGFNGNIAVDDPMLSSLGDFGGSVPTMRPADGSPAIGAGSPAIADAPATDQRGSARIVGTIDIGAVEVDSGLLQIVDAVGAGEADGTVDVTITRVGGTEGAVAAQVVSADDTATAGDDYTAVDETIDLADGETEATVTVTLADDDVAEPTETFTLTLTGAAVDSDAAESTVTITDDDVPDPAPGVVSVEDVTVSETDGTAEVTITRADGSDGAASVTVTSTDGTATAGDDFTAVDEQVEWADGESGDKIVSVPVVDDGVAEDDETFTVTLSDAVTVAIDPDAGDATITITDDTAPVVAAATTPLPSARIVDTRASGATIDDLFEAEGKRETDSEYRVDVAGRADIPVDAKAAVLNVTAVGVDAAGFFTVHPCADPRPLASSLNYTAGVNTANEIVASLSGDGEVCVYTSQAAHVLIDVVGFVDAASPVVALEPTRYLDTRSGGETFDGDAQQDGRVAADSTTMVQIAQRAEVPADAAAVIVNVTVAGAADPGFLTLFACEPPVPNASALNFVAGVNRANEVITSMSDDGEICLFSSADTNLIVDVVGYVEANSSLTAVPPTRLLDTRPMGETVDGIAQAGGKAAADSQLVLDVAGRPGGAPESAAAVVLNVTAVGAEGTGFVTVDACLDPRPNASSLNFVAGVNVANELIVPLSDDGTVCLYTSEATHLLADMVAYIGA